MFDEGQRVWLRRDGRSFTVLECDGDRVYLVQDNGAEADFLARDLTDSPPDDDAPPPRPLARGEVAKSSPQAVPVRKLTAQDITPDHESVLNAIPVRVRQAVAGLYEQNSKGKRFSALDVAGKLNVISEITNVPYRMMREYRGRPGELGLLMGKGIADRRG